MKLPLAVALAAAGVMLVPAAASASTTINCSTAALVICQETDNPGSFNQAWGAPLASVNSGANGTFCLTPYYSSTGNVNFSGSAVVWPDLPPSAPQEVRWRVWFDTSANMANSYKVFKDESSQEDLTVSSGAAGYFMGCIVNYDATSPPVSFAIQVAQG